jgi:hypothetical protein
MPPGPESELIERDRAHPERASARRILTKSRLYAAVRDGVRALCPAVDAGAGRVSAFSLAALDTASREFTPRSFTRIFDFKKDRVPPLIEGAVPAERIERAHRDFVENLTAIARDGRAAGVPVLFVDSVRNLKADFYLRFHVDPRDVKPGYLERWRALYGSALDKQRVKDYPAAIIDFLAVRECYVKDHDEILAHHIASCHEAMGNLDKAREEFERAFMSRALKAKIREAASAGGAALADPYPALVKVSPGGIPDATMFTDAFHPMPMANAAIARTILDAILEGKLVKGDAPVPAGLAAVRAAIDGAAARVKLDPGKELQSAVYAGKYARALDIGSSKQLSQMLYVEKMYYGYAQSKLGRGEAARQTWNALREEVLGQGAQPSSLPKLDTDADVVRHIFDFDLFSEF